MEDQTDYVLEIERLELDAFLKANDGRKFITAGENKTSYEINGGKILGSNPLARGEVVQVVGLDKMYQGEVTENLGLDSSEGDAKVRLMMNLYGENSLDCSKFIAARVNFDGREALYVTPPIKQSLITKLEFKE
jgi:hypothetical protein